MTKATRFSQPGPAFGNPLSREQRLSGARVSGPSLFEIPASEMLRCCAESDPEQAPERLLTITDLKRYAANAGITPYLPGNQEVFKQ
jgi:hypothetical protein